MTQQRYIPTGYTEHRREGEAVVYYATINNAPFARGWRSDRQVNPDFFHRFRDEQDRDRFVTAWFEARAKANVYKEERKAERKAINDRANPCKVGDIFHRSWGYDQTNNNFYQVVEVKNKSVVVREIGKRTVDDDAQGVGVGSMASHVVAVPDSFKEGKDGEPMIKVVKWSGDKPYLPFDYGSAYPWDGKKKYESYYH